MNTQTLQAPALPGLLAPLPARWVYPEIAARFASFPAEAWPLKLYRETTAQWVEFTTPAELQAATLPAPEKLERPAWRGGQG